MEIEILKIPTHWVCPLEYGADSYGDMTDEEIKEFDRFVDDMVKTYGQCWPIDYDDEPHFSKHHAAEDYGVLACDCVYVTFDVTDRSW